MASRVADTSHGSDDHLHAAPVIRSLLLPYETEILKHRQAGPGCPLSDGPPARFPLETRGPVSLEGRPWATISPWGYTALRTGFLARLRRGNSSQYRHKAALQRPPATATLTCLRTEGAPASLLPGCPSSQTLS